MSADDKSTAAVAGPALSDGLGPLPEVVRRADNHYSGEGLADAVRAYAAAAVAAERERCALIAGDNYGWVDGLYFDNLADAIRGA